MRYYEDPILGKGRAADVTGGTGGSGTTYIGGFAIGISGDTISRLRYMPIESVTGNSVTLQAGHAYKAYATSTAITLNTETVPEGQFGMEGHIEIYVAGTGYVVTGTNVVLANALEPDSVNNCTLRFHDGVCIISVEDHVAGYIVVNGSTAGEGSLYYGITTSTNDYVAFDASLNGTTIPLAGAVAEGEKHIVGNGYTNTILTGGVSCTSKTTFSNLSMDGVVVSGGIATLGDANVSNGLTTSNGAKVVIEHAKLGNEAYINGGTYSEVTSDGVLKGLTAVASGEVISGSATVDFGGSSYLDVFNIVDITLGGVNFTSGYNSGYGGAARLRYVRNVKFENCTFSGNVATVAGNALSISYTYSPHITIKSCMFEANQAIILITSATINVIDSVIGRMQLQETTDAVNISGDNTIDLIIGANGGTTGGGPVTISSGASINLTNSIATGGGITVLTGGCTVNGVTVEPGTYTSIVSSGGSAVINQ